MKQNHDRKWAFRPGRAGDAAADIVWVVHDGKNRGRSEGEENVGVFPVMVGGQGQAMHGGLCVSLVRACA